MAHAQLRCTLTTASEPSGPAPPQPPHATHAARRAVDRPDLQEEPSWRPSPSTRPPAAIPGRATPRSTRWTSTSPTASSSSWSARRAAASPPSCGCSPGSRRSNDGTIRIGDRDVTHIPPKDRDIAMVFQNYALYPHMSVADNMGFALKIAGMDKREIRRRVEEAAKILDLTDYLARKPKALSGGQRQRVAMGRAIVRQPQCFLMDEPLSNLDAKLRVQTRTQIAVAAAPPGHHHRLRHPRPGRGHDHGRPRRAAQGRPAPAGRHPPQPLRPARQHLRRRLHRLPRHEHLRPCG